MRTRTPRSLLISGLYLAALMYAPVIRAQAPVDLTIEPGAYGNSYDYAAGSWDTTVKGLYRIVHPDSGVMARNPDLGSYHSARKIISFETSVDQYILDTGTEIDQSTIFFTVGNAGITRISPSGAAAAAGPGAKTLRLNLVPVAIDPADYGGAYGVSFLKRSHAGFETVVGKGMYQLVPRMVYSIETMANHHVTGDTSRLDFFVGMDGVVSVVRPSASASTRWRTLVFNTQKLHMDFSPDSWRVTGYDGTDPKDPVLIQDLVFQIIVAGKSRHVRIP